MTESVVLGMQVLREIRIVAAHLSGHRGELVYRAVRPGPATIILSPDVPDGHCISCETLHYFVRVEP